MNAPHRGAFSFLQWHYVYDILEVSTSRHYIGVRTSRVEPILDIGIHYFSSSTDNEFIKNQHTHPENYRYHVLQEFDSRTKAAEYEIILHEEYEVDTNTQFLNRTKSTGTRFVGRCKTPAELIYCSGEYSPKFKGYWITPLGKFCTAALAAKAERCSKKTIIRWCSDNHLKINKRSVKVASITTDMLGLTRKACGFYFEPATRKQKPERKKKKTGASGTRNGKWNGIWITPKGNFTTSSAAAKANGVTPKHIQYWCRYKNTTVFTYITKYITEQMKNKTPNELGYDFKEKDTL